MGVAVADFDNDAAGHLCHGIMVQRPDRNLGNCKFEDVKDKAGCTGRVQHRRVMADYDRDGLVDLFVPRYVESISQAARVGSNDKTCPISRHPGACGPWGIPGNPTSCSASWRRT